MQKRLVPVILAAALLIIGVLSIGSIRSLEGSARVINYTGVVRGATQRLVKKELNKEPDNALITKLDEILNELATGEGTNGLERLDDNDFQVLIAQMQEQWNGLTKEIHNVRAGKNEKKLYHKSEEYFDLADRAVGAAEEYSKRQVRIAEQGLIIISIAFLLLSIFLAWYAAKQSRRQDNLKKAEEKNRAESQQLARMSEELRAPMNDISELIYVSDIETYEVLFVNETGQRTLGIAKPSGQKCYEVLQGLSSPCEFCSTPFLVPGENYTWEHTNLVTNRHYLLKDRLIQWDGRLARMEIAFDITEAEEEKQALKHTLDTEQMLMECVRTLYKEHDLEQAIPDVLEQLGCFLSADCAYLALVRGTGLFKDFEWGAKGCVRKSELLQEMSQSTLERWIAAFEQYGCIILEDIESLQKGQQEYYELLRTQNTHCLVAAPLEQDGKLKGVLVVNNPLHKQIGTITPLLQTLCYFLMLTYRRTENEQQLAHLSYFDTLTSFYNRNRFIEDTEALGSYSGPVGIVYVDVNGLKDINDQYGHALGDEVLVECAKQIRKAFLEADFYRIGGDEFVIICTGIDQTVFNMQTSTLRRHFVDDSQYRVAIGSQWTSSIQDVQQIIADADAEMYEDKKAFYRTSPASNRYRHLSDEVLRLTDPEVLGEELRNERFLVYLQPKISTSDRSVIGAEALVRYRSRTGSLMLPGFFLPILENNQTISQIDFYVFEHICSRLKSWSENGKRVVPVSVNFSRCTLSQPNIVPNLRELCKKYGVETKYLEIELTETAHEASGVNLSMLIRDLRQAGFIVSIDDFGTEYANLALLSQIDFDVLKLDKGLVDDVAHNSKSYYVIESIVNICKKVEIKVVAEGIETEEQFDTLRSCGVKLGQGFLFSKPIPIADYEKQYL